jgi:hypothetical protein
VWKDTSSAGEKLTAQCCRSVIAGLKLGESRKAKPLEHGGTEEAEDHKGFRRMDFIPEFPNSKVFLRVSVVHFQFSILAIPAILAIRETRVIVVT